MRKIGEGATVFSGYAFKSTDFAPYGIPVIKIKNVNNRIVTLSEIEHFPQDKVIEKMKKFFLENGDVLIAMTGQGSVGRVGKLRLSSNQKVLLNQRVGKFITKLDVLDTEFLYQIISSSSYEQILFDAGSGSGQPNLSPGDILDVEIPFPDINNQRKIAMILSHLDDKVWFLQRQNEVLEKIIQSIFKSWFIDFDGQSEFVDSELGQIPNGWRLGTIGDLCEKSENGSTPKRDIKEYWDGGNILWFKTGELIDGPLFDSEEKITQEGLENSSCKVWEVGTILVAMYGATAGKLGILTRKASSNQACNALLAKTHYGNLFLFYTLKLIQTNLINSATGSAQQNLNKDLISKQKILIPADKICMKFQDVVEPIYRTIVENENKKIIITYMRDSLFPKLISGEIQV